jgi:Fic family protein
MIRRRNYIWQYPSWPKFQWNSTVLLKSLGECRFQQGSLLTQMRDLGFEVQQQARAEVLIEETLKTSEIEGVRLDTRAVRSSVVRRLGLPAVRNAQNSGCCLAG